MRILISDPFILQSLTFVAGYTVHSIYKSKVFRKPTKDSTTKSMCPSCLSLQTEDKYLEFEEPADSIYGLRNAFLRNVSVNNPIIG